MHILIIGNGISGITTARYIRKRSQHQITVVSAETPHFFSRTALMYVYMGHMRFEDIKPYEDHFWAKNRIQLLTEYARKIDTENHTVEMASGQKVPYDKLVLATGSKSNRFGWPGQDLPGVQGLYSYQDLQTLEQNSATAKAAVVVGGGLIGIELGEMLASRNIPVTFLVREQSYWDNVLPAEESKMVTEHIREHHFDLRLGTELKRIKANEAGRASAVETSDGDIIPADIVGLTAGVSPNTDLARSAPTIDVDRGILINTNFETSAPDVYAIGDCAQFRQPLPGRRNIEQVWYTGKLMGRALAATLCGTPTAYAPGIWYNSAKFLDLEYQIYGDVPSQPEAHQASLFWKHPKGRKSIRIVYDKQDGNKVLGFNLMGIRYRHAVCDRWLREGSSLRQVLAELKAANFDPEFFRKYEAQLLRLYQEQTGDSRPIAQKPARRLRNLIFPAAPKPMKS